MSIVHRDIFSENLVFYNRVGNGNWKSYLVVPFPVGDQMDYAYGAMSDLDVIFVRTKGYFFAPCDGNR